MLRLLALTAALASASAQWTNSQARRTVDASKHIVHVTTEIKAVATSSTGAYAVAVPAAQAARLAHIAARLEDEPLTVQRDASADIAGFSVYKVVLPSAAREGEEIKLSLTQVFTGLLEPYPAEIAQNEAQLVRVRLPVYFPSPYAVERQSTTFRLPPSSSRNAVESFSKEPAPAAQDKASTVKYGPYGAQLALTAGPEVAVHFEVKGGFLTAHEVEREVEVSMWGNVAVEEHYSVRNTGAALKGGFSRLDFQLSPTAHGNAIESLRAVLPAKASEPYYRDIIGNISTSNFRVGKSEAVLEIRPRFPLFGGWRTEWYQGYNVPAEGYVTVNSDTGAYTLSYPALPPFADMAVEAYTLKLVLPEAASVLAVEAPFAFERSDSRRFTFLDGPFFGRPVVALHTRNLITSGGPAGAVRVTFTLPPGAAYYKIGYGVAGFALLFALASLVSRISLSVGTKPKTA